MTTDGSLFTLQNSLQVVRRRLPWVLVLTLLLPIGVAVASQLRTTQYVASSQVLIHRDKLATSLTGLQVPYTDAATAERVIETQVQLARLPDLAASVIKSADLQDRTPQDFLESSEATARPKADIVELSVIDPSAVLARRLATVYADEFVDYRLRLDANELEQAASGVEDQIGRVSSSSSQSLLLSDLQDRLKQVRTLQALQTPSAIVVRRAEKAESLQPSLVTQLLGATLVGALLGVGIALLTETIDSRVRSSQDIADRLGIPLLARIVAPAPELQEQRKLVLLEDPDAEAAESFAFLRTGLQLANERVAARTIMVTSAVEQEGKSTVLANLAVACARAGMRVLLIDVDFWRPTSHAFFGLDDTPGLTDVLRRRCSLDEAVHQVDVSRAGSGSTTTMEVLPSGGHPQQAPLAELAQMFKHLVVRAELVLIDGPPLLRIGDALAITRGVDAVLVVTRLNVVRDKMLDELRRLLAETPTPKLGFVVTNAEHEDGYRSDYRYGYSYKQTGAPKGRIRRLAGSLGSLPLVGHVPSQYRRVAVPEPMDQMVLTASAPTEGGSTQVGRHVAPDGAAIVSPPQASQVASGAVPSSVHHEPAPVEERLAEIEARIRSARARAEASAPSSTGGVAPHTDEVAADEGAPYLEPDSPAPFSQNGPKG